MIKEAMLYDKLDNNRVQCNVCSHRCIIKSGKKGFCRVRENRDGTLYTLIYGIVSSEAVDPIEKKPLFNFYPGSLSYSLGTVGCNFRCRHCQNWTISQVGHDQAHYIEIMPDEAVSHALKSGSKSISWTYNEPTIWYEYIYDCAKLAKENGLATVYVTNGYITPEALHKIAPYIDAFRVDIKAFTEEFYRNVCSAKLAPVLESVILAKELGMHVEVINLVIPTLNDSADEIRQLCKWICDNPGADTPIHFTRFHPYYKMRDFSSTPVKTLEMAHDIAKEEGLRYVYIGNVFGHEYENTFCHGCGNLLIRRELFNVREYNITPEGTCPDCGVIIPIILERADVHI